MNDWPALNEFGAWILGALGLVGAAWKLRRVQSGDQLAVKKNDSEGGWITRLEKDRNSAVENEKQLAKDMAVLNLKYEILMERFQRLEKESAFIRRLLIEARPEIESMLNSGFAGLWDQREKPR